MANTDPVLPGDDVAPIPKGALDLREIFRAVGLPEYRALALVPAASSDTPRVRADYTPSRATAPADREMLAVLDAYIARHGAFDAMRLVAAVMEARAREEPPLPTFVARALEANRRALVKAIDSLQYPNPIRPVR